MMKRFCNGNCNGGAHRNPFEENFYRATCAAPVPDEHQADGSFFLPAGSSFDGFASTAAQWLYLLFPHFRSSGSLMPI
jgi:hypothetical protein